MSVMKLSISLSEDDVATLDRYVAATGLTSRSAGLQVAIRQLRDSELDSAYVAAWEEWEASGDAGSWDATRADGLGDAAR